MQVTRYKWKNRQGKVCNETGVFMKRVRAKKGKPLLLSPPTCPRKLFTNDVICNHPTKPFPLTTLSLATTYLPPLVLYANSFHRGFSEKVLSLLLLVSARLSYSLTLALAVVINCLLNYWCLSNFLGCQSNNSTSIFNDLIAMCSLANCC